MNGSIHSSPAHQRTVRGVHDRIDGEQRDISFKQAHFSHVWFIGYGRFKSSQFAWTPGHGGEDMWWFSVIFLLAI
ncbi:MAG: hypothetical protein KDC30_14800, partial [Saprospiraceae bacterium]|nr:hypothetical protein [Saprospiraceae bacterium]